MLNRKQRRQLSGRPNAEQYRNQTTIKLLNRLNNYKEILSIIDNAKTIKQIRNALQQRIDSTQQYLAELNKEDKD